MKSIFGNLMLVSLLTLGAFATDARADGDDFCDGFKRGYITGYKKANDTAITPLTPMCPMQPMKQFGDSSSAYERGYTTGYDQGTQNGSSDAYRLHPAKMPHSATYNPNSTALSLQPTAQAHESSAAENEATLATEKHITGPHQDRWLTVYSDDKKQIALDTQTVRKAGNDAVVWIRQIFENTQVFTKNFAGGAYAGKEFNETLILETHYCGHLTFSVNQLIWKNAAGETVASHKNDDPVIQDIAPESVAESEYKAACSP